MGELTQNKLKELLHYDPLSGIFTWRKRPLSVFNHCKYSEQCCNSWNTRFSRKEAGTVWTSKRHKTSYVIITISLNGKVKSYFAHRLAILYSEGYFPSECVDHIDGNGCNNSRANLREVDNEENMKNRPMYSNNTSGCVGVTWVKRDQKWQVQIYVDGKNIYGGLFTNIENATAKRKQLEIEYDFHKNHGRNKEKY